MGNIEDGNQSPLRVRLQIFNQVSRNGSVYIADTKEDVEKIFSKFINKKAPLVLTNKCQDTFVNDHHDIGYFKKFTTVDISTVAGCFTDIDIVETGEIGLGNKPVYEVWADMKYNNSSNGDYVRSLMEEEVMTFGMRSIGRRIFNSDLSNLDNPPTEISRVISFDLISAHPACKLFDESNNIRHTNMFIPPERVVDFDYEGDDIGAEALGKMLLANHEDDIDNEEDNEEEE